MFDMLVTFDFMWPSPDYTFILPDRNTYRSGTPVRKGNSTFDGPPRGEIPYNDQIRHKSRSGIVYDPAGNVIGREDTRPKVGPWVLNANVCALLIL